MALVSLAKHQTEPLSQFFCNGLINLHQTQCAWQIFRITNTKKRIWKFGTQCAMTLTHLLKKKNHPTPQEMFCPRKDESAPNEASSRETWCVSDGKLTLDLRVEPFLCRSAVDPSWIRFPLQQITRACSGRTRPDTRRGRAGRTQVTRVRNVQVMRKSEAWTHTHTHTALSASLTTSGTKTTQYRGGSGGYPSAEWLWTSMTSRELK